MSELLGVGIKALIGLLVGLAMAVVLHWLTPDLDGAQLLYALFVGGGFVIGLVLDGRSRKR